MCDVTIYNSLDMSMCVLCTLPFLSSQDATIIMVYVCLSVSLCVFFSTFVSPYILLFSFSPSSRSLSLPFSVYFYFRFFFSLLLSQLCRVCFIRFITSLLIIKIVNFSSVYLYVCVMYVFSACQQCLLKCYGRRCVSVSMCIIVCMNTFCSIKLLNPLFYDSLLTIFVLISVWPHCWINTDFSINLWKFVNVERDREEKKKVYNCDQ